MRSYRFFREAIWTLAAATTPFLVYFDLSFGRYALTNNAIDPAGGRLGNSIPVADPAAGAFQDHPWLTLIGRSLHEGIVPIVNLYNGLGSPLLESLQSGVFYPMNILLFGLNVEDPTFFGKYMLCHVSILIIGLTILLRLYLPIERAVLLATAFALAPISFSALNMVHYRAFVWLPLAAWSYVRIARGTAGSSTIVIGAFALFTSFAAGNPQETLLGLSACILIFLVELIQQRSALPKAILSFALTTASAILLSCPAVLPYVFARREGSIVSVEASTRSTEAVSIDWLPSWFVPNYQGVLPEFFKTSTLHDAFSIFSIAPAVTALVIAGLLALTRKESAPNRRVMLTFAMLLGVAALGIMKVFGSPLLGFISSIPVVNTFRLTKYVNYIHLLLAVAAALVLAWTAHLGEGERRRIALQTALVVLLITGAAVATGVFDPNYHLRSAPLLVSAPIWIGAVISVAAVLVAFVSDSRIRIAGACIVVVIAALLMRPYGFWKAATVYAPMLASEKWREETRRGRVLSSEPSNTNLLRRSEVVGVFDPILNAAFARLMRTQFTPRNPAFDLTPADLEISKQQVEVLRFLGATSVFGYDIEVGSRASRIQSKWWRIEQPLPRAILINAAAAASIEAACANSHYDEAVQRIEAATIARGTFEKDTNQVRVRLDASGDGLLIALLAFTPAWHLDAHPAQPFCNLLTSWPGSFSANRQVVIAYRPRGLTLSYPFFAGGICMLLLSAGLSWARLAKQ